MQIYTFKTDRELDEAGAGIVISLLRSVPGASLGLATGQTPVGVYEELVKAYRKGHISFKKVNTYNLDEYRGVGKKDPRSFYAFMHQHLFQHIDLPEEQIHIPDGEAEDVILECNRYDALLGNVRQLDLQILGIGLNGHIGFNEPNFRLSYGTHAVILSEETRRVNSSFFHSLEEVPEQAITMGVGAIMKAKKILFIARGEKKAEIVHRALTGPITTECPASLLQLHPDVIVLLDEGAGKLIG
ncbi:glucosamine-6-phosphate deaminase [Paenibacillus abyssi]|uniref:Glucosamine-6-phosphate deaminase n=1 Tax=Paenibacillus abyssi TaxID=1340531 RepID=A0A917CYF6_9BACL|nr:glucosamine-6-phosphate deaminase [Paenibacillus abyssi]GGG01559.1 glucosamine-6-phosphate deaminase [Paenibacillus abyssi]